MTCTCTVHFDDQLMDHIRRRESDEAKSILDKNAAKVSMCCGTLLHHAVAIGNVEVVQFLVEQGSDVNFFGQAGKTPLMIAAILGHGEIVRVLLKAGADMDIADADGQNALHWTVISCEIEIFKCLLRHGCDVNSRGHNGRTALNLAAMMENLEFVKMLVDNGADVNALDSENGSPLLTAATKRQTDVMRFLLKRGADPTPNESYKSDNGVSIKTELLDYINKPLFRVLIVRGYDKKEDNIEAVELLLRYGAFPRDLYSFLNIVLDFDVFFHTGKMNCLIAHHAMLQVNGSSTVQSIVNYENEKHPVTLLKLKKYYKTCQQILDIEVFGKLSLLDLLTESKRKMRIHARNEAFASKMLRCKKICVEQQLEQLYPYYYVKLMRLASKAERRVELEKEAIPVISDIFKRNHNECYLAARGILCYLGKRDLEQLCRV